MKILNLVEINDWEGETWNFFFWASEENEARLRKILEDLELKNIGDYSIEDDGYTMEDVEKFLKRKSHTGYMDEFNFLGTLELPKKLKFKDDPFYKGGIEKFCKKEEK